MFPDKKSGYGGLDDLISTYMGVDDSFYSMSDGSLDYAMDALSGYLTKEKSKPVKDTRSTRLKKGQPCPVCDHSIAQETFAYGGREFLNKCQKCGLTDESSNWDTVHQLSLEEFQWTYRTEEEDNIVNERAKEEGFVLSLYRKIWSGEELSVAEDVRMEEILASQKEAVLVK